MLIPVPARRPRGENIVPMINVVFLLLVFFLMTSEIAPPEPFAVDLPEAAPETPSEGSNTLHVAADGQIGWQDLTGEAAIAAFVAAQTGEGAGPAQIRADRAVEAGVIAKLLPQLAAAGIGEVSLLTAAP